MERIKQYKAVPVVVIDKLEDTVPKLNAMLKGSLPIAEITYRTACAREAIALAIKEFPQMLIGAGTVVNEKQAREAIALCAKFIVSPGFSAEVSRVCREAGTPYFPGCVTPTEIMMAIADGWTVIKFFPANVYGGLKAMKALAAPFPQITFIPTGGVDASNLKDYLSWEKIEAVGGSWMMKGTESDIEKHCKKIEEIVKEAKGE